MSHYFGNQHQPATVTIGRIAVSYRETSRNECQCAYCDQTASVVLIDHPDGPWPGHADPACDRCAAENERYYDRVEYVNSWAFETGKEAISAAIRIAQ